MGNFQRIIFSATSQLACKTCVQRLALGGKMGMWAVYTNLFAHSRINGTYSSMHRPPLSIKSAMDNVVKGSSHLLIIAPTRHYLPRNFFSISQKLPRERLRRFRRKPDRRVRSCRHTSWCALSAHVCLHPARTHRVHGDSLRSKC